MVVKLFVKDDCPQCPAAKRAVAGVHGLEVFNVDDPLGLAEAAFHGVLATPSILVFDHDGREVASWRGESPDPELLRAATTLGRA